MLDGLRDNGARVCTLALMERGAAALGHGSHRVIAVSHALARAIADGGVPRRRIRVIAPGVSRTAASRRPAREVRGLCVANWTKEKGIRTLLAAIEWLPDVKLDLVGGTPDRSYARGVHADLRRARLRRRVRVHGVKRGAGLRRMYARATFFALPSIRESYGMAVSEALAAGLPVIACDIPATREVTGGAALLVPRGRVDPLADAIDRVAHDARLRERLSRRARERAQRFATWSESEREFVREVRRLLKEAL
jgi:glycosyltransferase involved in cell wall biosynthesis